MIPVSNGRMPVKTMEYSSRTYRMDREQQCIRGNTDGLAAVEQAVYKILGTERYKYPIYSHNYGTELADLFGEPISYVIPELKRRITDALLQDSRIKSVDSFEVTRREGGILDARFTVSTVYGDIKAEKAVNI